MGLGKWVRKNRKCKGDIARTYGCLPKYAVNGVAELGMVRL